MVYHQANLLIIERESEDLPNYLRGFFGRLSARLYSS